MRAFFILITMKTQQHLHFIGIGGIGMSGLALIAEKQGHIVSGCDNNLLQKSITDLKKLGCIINNHASTSCNSKTINTIIYSSAIAQDNPELLQAKKKGLALMHRSELLAQLTKDKYTIAIAGSHGKTTTSSLLAHILLQSKYDPTICIGGHLQSISSNAHYGASKYCVIEADESDRSLLNLFPTLAIITNIDFEHLETYDSIDDVMNTFQRFLEKLPQAGKALLYADDTHTQTLLHKYQGQVITFGKTKKADWQINTVVLEKEASTFVLTHNNKTIGPITVAMPGYHNVLNATAAFIAAHDIGIDHITIAQALVSFSGVDRRFTFKGLYNGAEIFDDYGHHPLEIENTITVARKRCKGKLYMLFQPHRYSRTQGLWNDFITMFAQSTLDHLFITDIYPASEKPLSGVTSEQLVKKIKKIAPHLSINYLPLEKDFSTIAQIFLKKLSCNDLLLLQGAGKINSLAEKLISKK